MKNPDSEIVIKVAIADDHALFRTGVKTSLSIRKDVQMVAEAENRKTHRRGHALSPQNRLGKQSTPRPRSFSRGKELSVALLY